MQRLDIDGPAAPPRRNGSLVFDAPWESRAFALAVALSDQGLFAWDLFRDHLIREIAAWEQGQRDDDTWCYYERWLAALEALLFEKGLLNAENLRARALALTNLDEHRPPFER